MADRRRPLGRLLPALAAVLGAVLLVAGCAGIPTDGPVTQGRSGQEDAGDLRVIPPDPAAGASPEEIVRGFLLAAGETDSEYSTSRKFLTPHRATRWQPDAGTIVYSRHGPQVSVSADGRAVPDDDTAGQHVDHVVVTVEVSVVATIDARGRYATADADTTQEVRFDLVKVDGQWRIDQLPDGVLVAESFLRLVYRSFELYFLDPSRTALVPETRWFPRRDATATILTRELLGGPSPWLAGAVRSSFPDGTELAPPGSVRIEGGVARVDLSSHVLKTTDRQRALLLAQLQATLLPVEGVVSVAITVAGGEIDVPSAPASLGGPSAADPSPVLLQDGRLVRLNPGGVAVPVEGLPDLTGRDLSRPGVSYPEGRTPPADQRYAVLSGERSQLLVLTPGQGEAVPPPVLVGADLTAPSFDRYGWVWSTSAVSGGSVSAVSPAGEVVQVAAPWLSGRRVTSLRISRDGTRAVLASTDADGVGHVEVAGVVRDDDLVPRALSPDGPMTTGVRLVRVEEAVWLDQVEVAALGRTASDGQDRVHLLRLGGPNHAPLSPAPGARGLAAGNGPSSVLVSTTSGEILEQAGAAWVPVRGLDGARDPAFAG